MGAYGSPDLNNNNDLNLNNLKKCKNCGRLYFKAFKVCPKCGKSNDNKSTVLIFWIIILALVIYLFSINIPNIINYYNRINENKNYIEKYENKELIYRTDLTFEQLSRTPDIYVGEYIEFTGTVIWNIDDINGYNVCLIVI